MTLSNSQEWPVSSSITCAVNHNLTWEVGLFQVISSLKALYIIIWTFYRRIWKENSYSIWDLCISLRITGSKISPWKVLGQNNKYTKTTLYSFQLFKISYIEAKCKLKDYFILTMKWGLRILAAQMNTYDRIIFLYSMVVMNRNGSDIPSISAFFKHPKNLVLTPLEGEETLTPLNRIWFF